MLSSSSSSSPLFFESKVFLWKELNYILENKKFPVFYCHNLVLLSRIMLVLTLWMIEYVLNLMLPALHKHIFFLIWKNSHVSKEVPVLILQLKKVRFSWGRADCYITVLCPSSFTAQLIRQVFCLLSPQSTSGCVVFIILPKQMWA